MKTDFDTPQEAAGAGSSPSSCSSVVWLRCEWKHWVMNTSVLMLPTLIVGVAALEIPAIRFMAGLVIGLWFGMAHNCIWAWLSRKNRQTNA